MGKWTKVWPGNNTTHHELKIARVCCKVHCCSRRLASMSSVHSLCRLGGKQDSGQHSPFLCGGQMDQHTLSEAIFLFWSEFITFPQNFDLLQELLKFLPTWRGRALQGPSGEPSSRGSSSHCPPEGSS